MDIICFECINDDYLKSNNLVNTIEGNCGYCNTQNTKCITLDDLAELFEPLIHLYSPIEEFMFVEEMKNLGLDGSFIWEKIQEVWELFPEFDDQTLEELFNEMFVNDIKDPPLFLTSFVEYEDVYYGIDWQITEELEKEWRSFCEELKYKNRYFPQKTIETDFLGNLLDLLKIEIPKNSLLFRARIPRNNEEFSCKDLGKPPKEISRGGRANPQGIPYLYVASDSITAVSEVRPSINEKVTVGEFIVKDQLSIVDLRNPGIDSPFRFGQHLSHYLMHIGFLGILSQEISKPINPKDAELDYLPLQYLCEFIKNQGYDGVAYISSLTNGYNLAIFSDDKLECLMTETHEIKKIDYEIEKVISQDK